MTTWTAAALDFYTDEPFAEQAAEYASELINIYADPDNTTPTDLAAYEIAEETSISYPNVGANDTASREAIWKALSIMRSSK